MTAPDLRLPVPGEHVLRTYTRFREAGPMVPVELPGGVNAWAATTYAAIREVLSGDSKVFGKNSSHWADLQDGKVPPDWPILQLILGEHMLMRDGAEHRRLRGLLSKAFTRARVEALRPRIEEIVDGLLDRVAAEGAGGEAVVDLVPLFSDQVPTAVICEMFGVDGPRRSELREWTQKLFSQVTTPEEAQVAGGQLFAYLGELVEEKRREPGDDLTSALVRAQQDEDRLSPQELVDSLFLLLIAGHETTVNLLGHAIVNLLAHPDQLARAKAGDLWDAVAEETLRFNAPIAAALFRYPLAPVEVAGVQIPQGDPIMVCLGGAATDPEQYGPTAGAFDISREQIGHLAFGYGAHTCLGAPLARLEAYIALSRLFARFPGIEAAVPLDDIAYSPSFLSYGPLSIPVRV
ncbi:cytochrome P450 family protein [Acrocarpospora phusangensis]|uniref:cytochrome P450 family protein n=1 Tax=Acrocarpospora phusangensis TaxID=1070424 RepID=UPI0019517B2B|nr:cytochrome P450 [Acrocarpospora phusangensis]